MINRVDTISTLVGNDTASYNGDGRLATSAELWYPEGLFAINDKDIYIADRGNFRIRWVTISLEAVSHTPGNDATISLFPNPNTGSFTLKMTSTQAEPVQIIIMNVAGEKVKEISGITNGETYVQFNQPAGMYFLSATTSHGTLNEKLIVR